MGSYVGYIRTGSWDTFQGLLDLQITSSPFFAYKLLMDKRNRLPLVD